MSLEYFDIGKLGFLPDKCVKTLPAEFAVYLNIISNIRSDNLQNLVDELQYYDYPSIKSLNLGEKKYLYSTCAMITHRYVWSDITNPKKELPYYLGKLFTDVSKDLGIVPVLTHAAVDLWNWHIIDETLPFSLDNIKSINLMLNHDINSSEEWFYLIMVAIEGVSASAIIAMNNIGNELKNTDVSVENIYNNLKIISENLNEITKIIKRMYEKCDPDVFFHKLRIYLSGFNNKDIFPEGLKINNMPEVSIEFNGGSAAQSSLLQAYDIFLSINHKTLSTKEFLDSMKNYMPQKHMEYLLHLDSQPKLKNYIETDSKFLSLKDLFNTCCTRLSLFRSSHLALIKEYIMKFVPAKVVETVDIKENNVCQDKGTGGTNPVEFCSDVIKDTIQNKLK